MQTIYLDISNKGVVPTIYAKQGDVGRKFEVVFTDSGIPYSIPTNAKISIWYEGDSGVGNYTDIGEDSAIAIGENKAVVELITQMLSKDGEGIVCLVMNAGNNQIGSWNIRYLCERVPGFDSEGAKEYYTAFSKTVESLKQVTENLTLELIGAAPASHVKKTFFTIPANGAASIAFSGITNAMIYCRGFGGGMTAVFNYSGYAAGDIRQELVTIMNGGMVSCSLNLDSVGQGMTIKNLRSNIDLNVCIDSGLQEAAPVITFTADNAAELYTEYPNPPMALGVEYRTTERFLGKPVYTKVIDVGTMPANNSISISHGIANIDMPIRIDLLNNNGETFTNHPWFSVRLHRQVIYISTNNDNASTYTAKALLKYTKATD